jgi:S1-C subfamily serine protease
MQVMVRALILAVILAAVPAAAALQAPGVLQVKVLIEDTGRNAIPAARHALLVSDNPPSAPPRRIVTAADGTATMRLPPGSYTVESDRPVVFQGRAFQWTQLVDVAAGRETVLELTAANADTAAAADALTAGDVDPASILIQWQDSVVTLWTPTKRASGFLVGENGLIATSQRVLGGATAVDVQLASGIKVGARVLSADAGSDVAILWIDGTAAHSVRPVPMRCAEPPASIVNGQKIFAVGNAVRQRKDVTAAVVIGVGAHTILADLVLSPGAAGGPVFTADGGLVGMSSIIDGNAERSRESARIIRVPDVCMALSAAERMMPAAAPPPAARLPVEPQRPFPAAALQAAARNRPGGLEPYHVAADSFDVILITPPLIYSARERADRTGAPDQFIPGSGPSPIRPLHDFANWSDYVSDFPPVLLVRVTPRMVEGFWAKVARGAARTQGMKIPPLKQFTSGFDRMRAFCGDVEVTPIHAFKLEQRIGGGEPLYEGLYAYDPGALAPSCSSVKLLLYTEKDPQKGDTRIVNPAIIQQVWEDFAPHRAQQ